MAKKGIKKTFFEVTSPLTSAKVSLYASSLEELEGKVIKLDMTRSLRVKNLELKLKIKKEGDKLLGDPISIELLGSYIRKMIRKGTDYIEDSFKTEAKDTLVIVKPFMITRNKVSKAVRRELRNATKKHLEAHFKTRSSKDLFSEIMTNKIQKELSLKLKKIYPLALCEIRMFKILTPIQFKEERKEIKEVKEPAKE